MSQYGLHDFDDDTICRRCGFDGAEWWHLERMKPKEDREQAPPCRSDEAAVALSK